MTFWEGFKIFLAGGFSFTAAIVTFEIIRNYSLGDKIKDIFLSEEKKLLAAKDRFVAAEVKFKSLLFKKKK